MVFGRRKLEKAIRDAERAAAITAQRWAKVTTLDPFEEQIENTPAAIEVIDGRQLPEVAGGFLFATDQAVHVAVETWTMGYDPGPTAPFLEIVRIPYGEVTKIQLSKGTVALWDGTDNLTALETPFNTISLEVWKAINSRTTHVPWIHRVVPERADHIRDLKRELMELKNDPPGLERAREIRDQLQAMGVNPND